MFGEECEIVLDDVVADQVRGSCGEFVQRGQGRGQSVAVAAPGESGGMVGAYRADRVDVLAALEVDGEQAGKPMCRQARPYSCHWILTRHTIQLSLAEAAAVRHGPQKTAYSGEKSHEVDVPAEGDAATWQRALRLLAAGRRDVEPIITHGLPPARAETASGSRCTIRRRRRETLAYCRVRLRSVGASVPRSGLL